MHQGHVASASKPLPFPSPHPPSPPTLRSRERSDGGAPSLVSRRQFPNGRDDASLAFDFGVQRLELRPPLLTDLLAAAATQGAALVAPWPAAGRHVAIACDTLCEPSATPSGARLSQVQVRAQVQAQVQVRITVQPDATTVVGCPSFGVIGRALAASCPELVVHGDRTAHVVGRSRESGKWRVEWHRAKATNGQARARPELEADVEGGGGDFDVVLLAFEAKKIAAGCASGYKMVRPSATAHVTRTARTVRHHEQWALMIAFRGATGAPFDAADVSGHGVIQWVANNSSKPGRNGSASGLECWVVHTSPAWAARAKWSRADVEVHVSAAFCALLAAAGAHVPPVAFCQSSRWGACTAALAPPATSPGPVWDGDEWMGACGDWSKGTTVCDAYEAGIALAKLVLEDTRRTATTAAKRPPSGCTATTAKHLAREPGPRSLKASAVGQEQLVSAATGDAQSPSGAGRHNEAVAPAEGARGRGRAPGRGRGRRGARGVPRVQHAFVDDPLTIEP